jgi:hypothetical protein
MADGESSDMVVSDAEFRAAAGLLLPVARYSVSVCGWHPQVVAWLQQVVCVADVQAEFDAAAAVAKTAMQAGSVGPASSRSPGWLRGPERSVGRGRSAPAKRSPN